MSFYNTFPSCILIAQRGFIVIFPYIYIMCFDDTVTHIMYFELSFPSFPLFLNNCNGFHWSIFIHTYKVLGHSHSLLPSPFTLHPCISYPQSSLNFMFVSFLISILYIHEKTCNIFYFWLI
jgi:hypothetical protein